MGVCNSWSLPTKVLGIWCALALFLFILRPSAFETLPVPEATPAKHIDAFVYIAMNRTAQQNNIDFSIASLRAAGGWRGDVFLLTDLPGCFVDLARFHDVKILPLESRKSLIEIKDLKPHLMQHLPVAIETIVYLDADIVVARPLGPFLQSLQLDLAGPLRGSFGDFDFGMFPDSKGHYVGWCSGCEKWHTGVIALQRRTAERDGCMREWSRQLLSGGFDTDQASIDAAEAAGHCPHARVLSTRHLLFAKDYIGAALSTGHTFLHLTGVERLAKQDYFYRSIVIPRIYHSLEPTVSASILTKHKSC